MGQLLKRARISLSALIIGVLGLSLVAAMVLATSWNAYRDHASIEETSLRRADAALDMLTSVHTQAMLNRRQTADGDPAIETLNGTMDQFSGISQGVQLWVSMGPKLLDYQRAQKQEELEGPRDTIDEEAIRSKSTITQQVGDTLRVTRPVILGRGAAADPRCASCHTAIMNIQPGEVVGTYSSAVSLTQEADAWRRRLLDEVLAATVCGLAVIVLAMALARRHIIAPIEFVAGAIAKLSRGDLNLPRPYGGIVKEVGELSDAMVDYQHALSSVAYLAEHDPLTELPNRARLNAHFAEESRIATALGQRLALVHLDFNGFKDINDTLGHAAGDAVLREVARRMRSALHEGEFGARIGGDEIACTKRFVSEEQLAEFATRLASCFDAPINTGSTSVTMSASAGIAIAPQDGDTLEVLLNRADLAMYRAKSARQTTACFYQADMDEAHRRQRSMSREILPALERGEFFLKYQVQMCVPTGSKVGYEALLRWRHPELGEVPPIEFIPVAEANGSIVELGRWVLRTACNDATGWPENLRVSVNVSPVQIQRDDLVTLVHQVLIETGLRPSRLEVEITESTLIADQEKTLHVIRQLKHLGITIALDDFGTGYSSLNTLHAFPFDRLKLDKSFLMSTGHDARSASLIKGVLALSKSMDIPVLAEGVEVSSQLEMLQAHGCDEAQGYLFGRPEIINDASSRIVQAAIPEASAA